MIRRTRRGDIISNHHMRSTKAWFQFPGGHPWNASRWRLAGDLGGRAAAPEADPKGAATLILWVNGCVTNPTGQQTRPPVRGCARSVRHD